MIVQHRRIAVALLLALGGAQFLFGSPPDQAIPRGGNKPEAEWMQRHEKLVELAKKGNIDVYFEGDSITDFWQSTGKAVWEKEFVPLRAADFAIWGDYTQHVLYRITNGELEGVNPKVVVLMIGTNNLGGFPPAETASGIKAIVDAFRAKLPGTKILLLGIFPRGATSRDGLRLKVDEVNALIAKFDDGKSVKYLNINDKFLDKDGNLTKEVMPDLIHPNAKGYQIWADAMREPLKQLLSSAAPAVGHAPEKAQTIAAGSTGSQPVMTLNGAPVADATPVVLNGGKLKLAADGDATFKTKGVTAQGNVSIEVGPTAPTSATPEDKGRKTLSLAGGLTLRDRAQVGITGADDYRLSLDSVSAQGEATLIPTAASVAIATVTSAGAVKLDGTSNGNTLGTFEAKTLEKQGKGVWTITGNSGKQTGMVAVHSGTLYVGKGASTGTGQVSLDGGATLKLAPGATIGSPFIRNGVIIDLADGEIGTSTCTGTFTGPNGGLVTIRFDLSDKGADHLIIAGCGNTPAISDLVQFNIISDTLTPGTYPLITNGKRSLQMEENHFAFAFTADPVPLHKYSTRQTVTVGGKKYELAISTYDEIAKSQVLALTVKEAK